MGTPLLDLNTLERPVISIDKRDYQVMTRDDFGLTDLLHIGRLYQTVAEVQGKGLDKLKEGDYQALEKALNEFVRLVMPELPDDVFGRLREGQKLAIVGAFMKLVGKMGAARPTATTPTGANGSPG